MAVTMPVPKRRARAGVEFCCPGDTVRLRSEAASKDSSVAGRSWTVAGVIEERDMGGAILTRYRVRTSDYRGDKVEREIDPAEILPGSLGYVTLPAAEPEVTIAPTDIPGYVRATIGGEESLIPESELPRW